MMERILVARSIAAEQRSNFLQVKFYEVSIESRWSNEGKAGSGVAVTGFGAVPSDVSIVRILLF